MPIQIGWASTTPHRDLGTRRPIVRQFVPKSPPARPYPLRHVRWVTSLFARDRDKNGGHRCVLLVISTTLTFGERDFFSSGDHLKISEITRILGQVDPISLGTAPRS